jgi:hypothetical protein
MKRQPNMYQKLKEKEPISVLQPARVSSRSTKSITSRAAITAVVVAAVVAVKINIATEGSRDMVNFFLEER